MLMAIKIHSRFIHNINVKSFNVFTNDNYFNAYNHAAMEDEYTSNPPTVDQHNLVKLQYYLFIYNQILPP